MACEEGTIGMSTDLKFKAWDKVNQRMCQVLSLEYWDPEPGGEFIPGGCYLVPECRRYRNIEELELLQYIGIKDAKGTEIYKDDILEFNDDKGSYRSVVDYVYSGFVLRPVNCMIPNIEMEHWTIIGNVYEHPQLLNGSTEV